jgi:hypothetical protein
LEQPPVSLRKALKEFADLKVVSGHGADQRHQVLANILGYGFAVHLDREVVAALGRIFVKRALEQVQGLVNLALELFFAELEEFGLFAHKYAYIYAYLRAWKSARQALKFRNPTKPRGWKLNCYVKDWLKKGSNHNFSLCSSTF